MEVNRKPHICYTPKFRLLSQDWMLFNVGSERDRIKVLDLDWQWGPSRFILDRWNVNTNIEPHNTKHAKKFDLENETVHSCIFSNILQTQGLKILKVKPHC